MDKMKMQDTQLMQASGDTMSTINDWSSVTGTTPTANGTNSQGTASQGAKRPFWQGLKVHKSGTIHTHSYAETNKHMYNWILLNTCSLIKLFCNQSFVHNMHQVNTRLSLATNAQMMITNLKAELPGYGTVWFDPQSMTNVLSFGNIAKQYPIQYLQESDTFQVQLHDCVDMNKVIYFMSWKDNNPERILNRHPHPKRMSPPYQQHHMSKLLKRTPSFSPQGDSPSQCG